MNKAQIIGNLGKDPEVRVMQNGERVCTLVVATSEAWKDKNTGERREATEWHRVVIYNGKTVEVAEKYLRKGSKVYIEGQIKTRKWQDQQGQDRYQTELVIGRFKGEMEMLDRAPGRGDGEQPAVQEFAAAPGDQVTAGNFDLDDEIPF